MLVDHLGDRVAQKHDVLVKGFDLALKLDAVDEINGNGDAILAKDVDLSESFCCSPTVWACSLRQPISLCCYSMRVDLNRFRQPPAHGRTYCGTPFYLIT